MNSGLNLGLGNSDSRTQTDIAAGQIQENSNLSGAVSTFMPQIIHHIYQSLI